MTYTGYSAQITGSFGDEIAKAVAEKRRYICSFFDIDWNDENMYDLLLNTRTMSVETATSLIIAAITAPEFKESSKEVEKNLEDMIKWFSKRNEERS
ncbi:MAG: hypothetical protein HGJ94_15070 [Desulfosarcina sp.]|nr:hypothetical protein [Desulfosarcina sp.]MBC2742838.1 hypothetical protein [Desulfosarcina sp.]MBC2765748.1 hypothetical protein [Desulfosarcina sp.]